MEKPHEIVEINKQDEVAHLPNIEYGTTVSDELEKEFQIFCEKQNLNPEEELELRSLYQDSGFISR